MSIQEYDPLMDVVFAHQEGKLNVTILPEYGGPTIKRSTYKMIGYIVGIILIVIIFTAIVLAIQYSSNGFVLTAQPNVDRRAVNLKKIKPGYINELFNNNSNPGAISQEMVASYNNGYRRTDDATEIKTKDACDEVSGTWKDGCTCPQYHWGKRCERVSYPTNYLMVDAIDTNKIMVKDVYQTDSLSFGEGVKCTDLCEQDSGCKGVLWNKYENTCSILETVPDINNLTFNPDVDGNIFIRKDRGVGRPLVTENVIMYNGQLTNRFWLENVSVDDKHQMVKLLPDRVSRLNFYPSGCLNDGLMPIIYSAHNFSLSEAKAALSSAQNGYDNADFYVHLPGKNSFSPPLSLTLNPYYVMPLSNNIDSISSTKSSNYSKFKLISGSRSITRSLRSNDYSLYSESTANSSISFDPSDKTTKMISSNWSS